MTLLKLLWRDSVFSKLIAATIIWIIGIVYIEYSALSQNMPWLIKIALVVIPISFIFMLKAMIMLLKSLSKSKLLVYLSTGGTCRDPIAKVITEQLLKEYGQITNLNIKALAISDSSNLEVSYGAKYAIKDFYGFDLLAKHKCERITREIIQKADLILVMSREALKMLELKYPQNKNCVYLFKEFFGSTGDVKNPWPDGRDEESLSRYINCVNEINYMLTNNIERLINALTADK